MVGRPEGMRSLGRPKHGRVDNIKIDIKDTGWDGMGCIDLAHNRDTKGSCEHGNEPSGSIKSSKDLEWLHNWRPLEKGSAPSIWLVIRNSAVFCVQWRPDLKSRANGRLFLRGFPHSYQANIGTVPSNRPWSLPHSFVYVIHHLMGHNVM
jgi:hypothetical protein